MSAAIDASALIAFLRDEPGADGAARHLRRSCLSAVNLAEVLEKPPERDDGAVAEPFGPSAAACLSTRSDTFRAKWLSSHCHHRGRPGGVAMPSHREF